MAYGLDSATRLYGITELQTKKPMDKIVDWFTSQTGQSLLEQERLAFDRFSHQIFGFQLVQIGVLDEANPMMTQTSIKQQVLLDRIHREGMENYLVADTDHLPVLTDSIDAVLLPHTLDFCVDPQQVLKEVERILIPEGRLIISGFNPVSLWGITRRLKRSRSPVPWSGHFVSYTRLHDWLSLLGFDVEYTEVIFFKPPLENPAVMKKLDFLDKLGPRLWPRFGSVYMIRAVKRVSRLTPIQPVWKRRPRLLSHVVEPSTRGMSRHH